MANINIHTYIGNGDGMAVDHLYSSDEFQWFKSDRDGNIYVMNTNTERCSRYNAEAQNGKRIPMATFASELQEMTERTHQKIVDQLEAEQAEQAIEEQETTEEVERIQQELNPQPEAKKERKPRAKKVQVGGMEFTEGETRVVLTPKQVDFIQHLPDTDFWERGVDSGLWIDVLADQITGQFSMKPMTVGAMISTLREKGLLAVGVDHINGRKSKFFELTELGKKIATKLGL